MKRFSLKNFNIIGEKDTEIIISKEQVFAMAAEFTKSPNAHAIVYYLNEELKP